jgi:hypothetical protein
VHDLDLREDPEFELDLPDDGEAELADPERRQLAQAVLDAVVRGTTIRDANRLTNLVFHIHHPDRDLTARLDPKREAVLAQQWRELQAQLVRPALDGGTTASSTATATATATTGARWPWGRRVLLVGDSHTDGAFGIELARLITAAGGRVQREAKVGSAVNHWLPLLPGLLRSHSPDVVIIALGANMRGYPSASGTSRWIRRAVARRRAASSGPKRRPAAVPPQTATNSAGIAPVAQPQRPGVIHRAGGASRGSPAASTIGANDSSAGSGAASLVAGVGVGGSTLPSTSTCSASLRAIS